MVATETICCKKVLLKISGSIHIPCRPLALQRFVRRISLAASCGKWRRFWLVDDDGGWPWIKPPSILQTLAVSWVPQRHNKNWFSMKVYLDVPGGQDQWLVNGLFHLLIINGVFLGFITLLILTFDPNFLGHPDIGESHDLQNPLRPDHQLGFVPAAENTLQLWWNRAVGVHHKNLVTWENQA